LASRRFRFRSWDLVGPVRIAARETAPKTTMMIDSDVTGGMRAAALAASHRGTRQNVKSPAKRCSLDKGSSSE